MKCRIETQNDVHRPDFIGGFIEYQMPTGENFTSAL